MLMKYLLKSYVVRSVMVRRAAVNVCNLILRGDPILGKRFCLLL